MLFFSICFLFVRIGWIVFLRKLRIEEMTCVYVTKLLHIAIFAPLFLMFPHLFAPYFAKLVGKSLI